MFSARIRFVFGLIFFVPHHNPVISHLKRSKLFPGRIGKTVIEYRKFLSFFLTGFLMKYLLLMALTLFRFSDSFGLGAANYGLSSEVCSPNPIPSHEENFVLTSISVSWAKKSLPTEPPRWYTCEGTARATATGSATKFDWQILNLTTGGIDAQKFGIGKTWFFGYIEPMNEYQIQVRESGTTNWFTKPMSVPEGCGIK